MLDSPTFTKGRATEACASPDIVKRSGRIGSGRIRRRREETLTEILMPWIESHTEVERHRKTVLMAADLGIKRVYMSGHLHALWHNAIEQQEDGDLSKWPNNLIAQMAEFDGDPDEFVALLKKHGWIDEPANLLHDWLDYAGDFLIWKYSRRHRAKLVTIWRKYGKRYGKRTGQIPDKHMQKSSDCPVNVEHNQPFVVGLVGKTSSSERDGESRGEGKTNTPAVADLKFEAFWKAYPKHTGKKQAIEQWRKEAGLIAGLPDQIIAAIEKQKAIREARNAANLFTPEWPDPVRYLKHHRWEDEIELPDRNGAQHVNRDKEPKGFQGIRDFLSRENDS